MHGTRTMDTKQVLSESVRRRTMKKRRMIKQHSAKPVVGLLQRPHQREEMKFMLVSDITL